MTEEKAKITRRSYAKYVGGIVVVAVVAAAGYGIYEATKPTPTPTPAPTTPTPSPTPTPTPTPTPPAAITLNVLAYAGPSFGEFYEPTLGDFQKETGIKLKVDSYAWTELSEKMTMELTARTGAYDVVCVCTDAHGT